MDTVGHGRSNRWQGAPAPSKRFATNEEKILNQPAPRAARLLACAALLCLAAGQSMAGTADLVCKLQYKVKGWSALVKVADGTGTITCADGTTKTVTLKLRSVGATIGKSQVDNGVGKFTDVLSIDDALGTYAQSEVHGGVGKSASAQVLTKGTVSLALAGAGEGIDLGVTVGELTIAAAK
jgi:hypothetical protein